MSGNVKIVNRAKATLVGPKETVTLSGPIRGGGVSMTASARATLAAGTLGASVGGALSGPPSVALAGGSQAEIPIARPAGASVVNGASGLALSGCRQGIAGPPGPGSEIELYEAAVSMGGHRAVGLDGAGFLIYASSALGIPAIGVIRDAPFAGDSVAVYRAGAVNGFAGLIPSSVYYLGEEGAIVMTPPSHGLLQPLGVAASSTEFLVEPDYPTIID